MMTILIMNVFCPSASLLVRGAVPAYSFAAQCQLTRLRHSATSCLEAVSKIAGNADEEGPESLLFLLLRRLFFSGSRSQITSFFLPPALGSFHSWGSWT